MSKSKPVPQPKSVGKPVPSGDVNKGLGNLKNTSIAKVDPRLADLAVKQD